MIEGGLIFGIESCCVKFGFIFVGGIESLLSLSELWNGIYIWKFPGLNDNKSFLTTSLFLSIIILSLLVSINLNYGFSIEKLGILTVLTLWEFKATYTKFYFSWAY